ncbi:hypothetical protein [Primorskyibacter marinus]|uniref:hypothetical protein n=1 Tax=Primorskyibacter marinus TaxID=1977320 RepID=UPI00130084F2|nr:hypothetical protein [Primorskyibacter marinus]
MKSDIQTANVGKLRFGGMSVGPAVLDVTYPFAVALHAKPVAPLPRNKHLLQIDGTS